jgi:hypothetical protein
MKNMLRIIFLLTLILPVSLFSQSIEKIKWIKVKAEAKDGGELNRTNMETTELIYFFKPNGKVSIITNNIIKELEYKKDKSIVKIGPYQTIEVEQITDSSLIVAEVPDDSITPNKIYRLYFIAENYYENYLNRNHLILFLNDSTVKPNSYFRPIFKEGKINEYILKKMDETFVDAFLSGSFLISASGVVSDIEYTEAQSISKSVKKGFSKILKSTNKCWEIPKLSHPYYFKIIFSFHYSSKKIDSYRILNKMKLNFEN